jgi:hypothetical protein
VFEANATRRSSSVAIGAERSPILCIDDFSAEPGPLVDQAARAHYIDVGPVYPGVRAPAPAEYVRTLLTTIAPEVERVFGAPPEDELELCAFSMVTTPSSTLKPAQRIPHFDGPEPRRFAFLHYLCAPHFGGTSFYRHRSTGFESVTPERMMIYRAEVERELRASPPAAVYMNANTEVFEQVHSVAASFNRLVIYRGNLLHSGDIPPGLVLIEDPRHGRLTINGFGFLRA